MQRQTPPPVPAGEPSASHLQATVAPQVKISSNMSTTITEWIVRGTRHGYRYLRFFFVWDIVFSAVCSLAITLTLGLGSLFLIPYLVVSYLALHLRFLYRKNGTPICRNFFDAFNYYGKLFRLAFKNWVYMLIGVLAVVVLYSVGPLSGPAGMEYGQRFVGYLLAFVPCVVVFAIASVFFILPALLVMDRGIGAAEAAKLCNKKVGQNFTLLLLYTTVFAVAIVACVLIAEYLFGTNAFVAIIFVWLGASYFMIALPGCFVVVYESLFPLTEALRLPDGRELPSNILQEEIEWAQKTST
jgi:hypothetical protein